MTKGFAPTRTKPKKERSPKAPAASPAPQPKPKEWKPTPGLNSDRWLSQKRWLWVQLAYIDEHGEEQVRNKRVFSSVNQAEAIARNNAMKLHSAWSLQHILVLDGHMPADLLPFPPKIAKYAEYYDPRNWIPPDIGNDGRFRLRMHLPEGMSEEEQRAIAANLPAREVEVYTHKN